MKLDSNHPSLHSCHIPPLLCHGPGVGSILFPSGFSFKSVKIDKLKKKKKTRIKLKTKESFRKVNINLVNITHTKMALLKIRLHTLTLTKV